MKATAVIGANFGDEGKGLVTDYLCAELNPTAVVRFNGGAQAGHTVVTPEGLRHVFSHFGCGTFQNIPTYLSHHFVVNPILFNREWEELESLGFKPEVWVHEECKVTTFREMLLNQHKETHRQDTGEGRHGSCGIGIAETVFNPNAIRVRQLFDLSFTEVLREDCTGDEIEAFYHEVEKFCSRIKRYNKPLRRMISDKVIFEGAQGLLLDQSNTEYWPHLTPSNTGIQNILEMGFHDLEPYYVTRSYLTRHGAGKFPFEASSMSFKDDTNLDHEFQGSLRFAPLHYGDLYDRCMKDARGLQWNIAFTHIDQLYIRNISMNLSSCGPTRNDVKVFA